MPADDVHMWDYAWEQVRGENPFMREAPVDCEVVAVRSFAVLGGCVGLWFAGVGMASPKEPADGDG